MTSIIKTNLLFAIPYEDGWFASRCKPTENGNGYYPYINQFLKINPSGEFEIILQHIKNPILLKDINNKLRLVIKEFNKSTCQDDFVWETEKAINIPCELRYENNHWFFSNSFRGDRLIIFCHQNIPSHYVKELPKDENKNELLIVDLSGKSIMLEIPINSHFVVANKEETAILVCGKEGYLILDNPFM